MESNALPDTEQYVMLSADEFIAAQNSTAPCDEPKTSTIAACSQVVAGTNYRLLFTVACPGQETETVLSQVYVPLPSSNSAAQVTDLQVYVP